MQKQQENRRKRRQKKRKRWEAEFPGAPSLQHLGRGFRNKAAASGQKCSGCFRRGGAPEKPRSAGDAWRPLRPGRALGRRLPSPGPPARTSGGCARGAPGQAGGPGADRRGEEAAKKRPGLGTAVTPRREIPVKEPPGLARGAGCWPRRSRAVAPSPADAPRASDPLQGPGRSRVGRPSPPCPGFLAFPPAGTSPDLKADLRALASIHPLIPVPSPALSPY